MLLYLFGLLDHARLNAKANLIYLLPPLTLSLDYKCRGFFQYQMTLSIKQKYFQYCKG
jgi:hypothetical protein